MARNLYDRTDAVFGRLASTVAKDLLKGNSVDVINSELIIVSGDKKLFAKKILTKGEMGRGGSMKGPSYPRVADRLVKRMIRGMLPWDRSKGRAAFKNLKCYIANGSVTEEDVSKAIKFSHKIPMKHSTIKEIVEILK